MPLNFNDPAAHTRVIRNVLMLADYWGGWTTGIASINQALASELASFSNINVYCLTLSTVESPWSGRLRDDSSTTLTNSETGLNVPVRLVRINLLSRRAQHTDGQLDDIGSSTTSTNAAVVDSNRHQLPHSQHEQQQQQQHPTASGPAVRLDDQQAVRAAFEQFGENPADFLASSADGELLPDSVAFIVGHAPISASAAVSLRRTTYTDSKVILFYHCIPNELDWTADRLSCPVPETETMIRLAEAADVVFSISPKVHAFFESKFRSSARIAIDHRLFVPLCAKNLFDVNGSTLRSMAVTSSCYCIAAFSSGGNIEDWMGIDIAICAAGKVADALAKRSGPECSASSPHVYLSVLNVDPKLMGRLRERLKFYIKSAENLGARIVLIESPSDPWEAGPYRQLTTGANFDLCLVPTRSEPYGQVGLETVSAGLPTLVSDQSLVASVINRLTPEPEHFLVKTTRDVTFVRQDAAEWCRRILDVIDHQKEASERSLLLQGALKRDEATRNTHDDFITCLLGGIGVKFQLTQPLFVSPPSTDTTPPPPEKADGPRELATRRRFDRFLLGALRQCWRVKRHPLQAVDELPALLSRLPRLPICPLITKVINALEENDRRIVAVDCEKGTLLVHCPDVYAVRDLWAMCDRINAAMRAVLLPAAEDYTINPVLLEYGLRRAATRVVIAGPEYLRYKDHLVALRQKGSINVL